jgi:hypothetical protein
MQIRRSIVVIDNVFNSPREEELVPGGRLVNYYQKMRIRNNEASKRARLKRRIKQVGEAALRELPNPYPVGPLA